MLRQAAPGLPFIPQFLSVTSANGAGAQNSIKPFHLNEATTNDVHAAFKSGAPASVRLVQAYLERLRVCDQAGPKLNVVIFLNPRTLEETSAPDEHLRKTGNFVGPLHGIALLLRDSVNMKDMPTAGGAHAWRSSGGINPN